MADKITLSKEIYPKSSFDRTIDTSFSEFTPTNPITSSVVNQPLPTVEQFFYYYNNLFYQIPKFGETNSHEVLVAQSSQYIGSTNSNDALVNSLIEEITELRQDNLSLQQQLVDSAAKTAAEALQQLNTNG